MSLEVPAGYFVEGIYGLETKYGPMDAWRTGTMDEGYTIQGSAFQGYWTYGEAVQWCWRDARRHGKVC